MLIAEIMTDAGVYDIPIYRGCDISVTAHKFAAEHGLNEKKILEIIETIKQELR
jgi:hypothetical protein